MKWKKPSGIEIETNDMKETVKYCKSLGWEPMNGSDPMDVPESEATEKNDPPKKAKKGK